MIRRIVSSAALLATAMVLGSGGAVLADHVRIEAPVVVPGGTVSPPPLPTAPQTLQADEIKANLVRANVIYTNRLRADTVRGTVYQGRDVKVDDSQGKIRAPEVVASVIYADEISANTVIADQVYVRHLDRR